MAIRKLPRSPGDLDAIRMYGALRPQGHADAALQQPARVEEFVDRIRGSVRRSLGNVGRLHGIRVERMFRAMVVAIGEFRLLMTEDAGDVYFDAADGDVQPPDYRLVTRDGDQMLIEVKGVPPARAARTVTLRGSDVDALARYAEIAGVALFFALYWPGWNRWTLVPEVALQSRAGRREIDLAAAMVADHMFRLGDATIATVPPLTLSVELTATAVPVRPGPTETVITDVRMSAGDVALDDALEANIAWTLLRYGSWEVDDVQTPYDDRSGLRVDLVGQPAEQEGRELARQQGFLGVGTLSSIYSSMFNEATLTEDGIVRQLEHEPVPGMMGVLIPRDYWLKDDRCLRLWRLEIQPAR